MNEVFTTPEARPESWGSTSPIAARRSGLNVMPPPRPKKSIGRRTSMVKVPSTGARAKRSRPRMKKPRPPTSGVLMPNLITRRSERNSDAKPQTSVEGRNARPTSSGL
jgi:hypothetical protein